MTNMEKFHFYMKNLPSPDHFITWNYLFAISACLSRKVIFGDPDFPIIPNIYLIFVGRAGLGKSLPAGCTRKLLTSLVSREVIVNKDGTLQAPKEVALVPIAPSTVSFEGLITLMSKRITNIRNPLTKLTEKFNLLSFILEGEIGMLFRQEHCYDLAQFFCDCYDGRMYEKYLKSTGLEKIPNPCLTLLGCCTPKWLQDAQMRGILQQGFASRTIFVYGQTRRERDFIIEINNEQRQAWKEIGNHLKLVAKVNGIVPVKPEVREIGRAHV